MRLATVQKWGNSHGIRIPKHLLDSLNWQSGEKISLHTRDNRLNIEKAPQKNVKPSKNCSTVLKLIKLQNLTGVNLWGVKYGKTRRHY